MSPDHGPGNAADRRLPVGWEAGPSGRPGELGSRSGTTLTRPKRERPSARASLPRARWIGLAGRETPRAGRAESPSRPTRRVLGGARSSADPRGTGRAQTRNPSPEALSTDGRGTGYLAGCQLLDCLLAVFGYD